MTLAVAEALNPNKTKPLTHSHPSVHTNQYKAFMNAIGLDLVVGDFCNEQLAIWPWTKVITEDVTSMCYGWPIVGWILIGIAPGALSWKPLFKCHLHPCGYQGNVPAPAPVISGGT